MDEKLKPVHPGEILRWKFLIPFHIEDIQLARNIGVPESAISDLTAGLQDISTELAVKLAAYFGNSTEFWLNLQKQYDLKDNT